MDGNGFDAIARLLSAIRTRRGAVTAIGSVVFSGIGLRRAKGAAAKVNGNDHCRELGHPCEGQQKCCDELACLASGKGKARRCAACPDGYTACHDRCVPSGVCCTDADCDDGNPCTIDTCDPVEGCQHTLAVTATCVCAPTDDIFDVCGVGRVDECGCGTTTEGVKTCLDSLSDLCSDKQPCDDSSDCPEGFACSTTGCIQGNRCERICPHPMICDPICHA